MIVINFSHTSTFFKARDQPTSHALLQVEDYGTSVVAYTHVRPLLHYTGLHRSETIFIPH